MGVPPCLTVGTGLQMLRIQPSRGSKFGLRQTCRMRFGGGLKSARQGTPRESAVLQPLTSAA